MIPEFLTTPQTVVPFIRIRKIRKVLKLGFSVAVIFCCLIQFSAVCIVLVGNQKGGRQYGQIHLGQGMSGMLRVQE